MPFLINKTFIVFAVLFTLLSIHIGSSAGIEEQTIVAATSQSSLLHVFTENMTHFIFDLYDGSLRGIGNDSAVGFMKSFNETFKLQAWVRTLNDRQASFLIYTNKFGIFVNYSREGENVRRLNYGTRREFIRHEGPDAAVRKNGKLIFFKGCEMAIRMKWNDWTEPTDVRDINLPCDVDAAWKVDDKAMVLKGDQVWTWGPRDQVSGPVPFCDKYKCGNDFALKAKP